MAATSISKAQRVLFAPALPIRRRAAAPAHLPELRRALADEGAVRGRRLEE